MAWSLTITPTITLNHGSLPFAPPANVIIKDYTTLTYKIVFSYSGLGTIKKYIAWFGDLKDNVSSPTKRIYLFNDSGTFTASSGSKSPSGSIFFDDNGLTAFGGQKFNAGEDMCINAFMQIMDNADSDPYIDEDFTQWFKIADWAPPEILGYTAYRVNALGDPDEAGTKIRYSMSANVTPLTGYGHGEFFLRYKRPADTTWTEVPIAENVNSIAVSGVELAGTFPLNESYMFEFVAHDGYVSSIAKSTVFTGSTCLHFNAQKNGIGVGKYSEGAGFDVGWDARFRGNVHFDNPAAARSALGVGDHSSTEIITGSHWIDGKPIYSKTLTLTATGNEWKSFAHGLTGYDTVWIDPSGSFLFRSYNHYVYPFGTHDPTTTGFVANFRRTENDIYAYTAGAGTIYLRLMYTKTAD